MSTVGEFIGHMFFAQDVAKAHHWKTRNEGTHLALQTFYEQIVKTTDRLAETWQGKGKGFVEVVRVQDTGMADIALIPFFTDVAQRCESFKNVIGQDTTLLAILDDILELVYITIDRLGRV